MCHSHTITWQVVSIENTNKRLQSYIFPIEQISQFLYIRIGIWNSRLIVSLYKQLLFIFLGSFLQAIFAQRFNQSRLLQPNPTCAIDQQISNGQCYDRCATGYQGQGSTCNVRCPTNFTSDAIGDQCIKPTPIPSIALFECPQGYISDSTGALCYVQCNSNFTEKITYCLANSYQRNLTAYTVATINNGNNVTCPWYSTVQVVFNDFLSLQSQYLSIVYTGVTTTFVSKVGAVIQCLDLAVISLQIGQTAVVTCPSNYAFGAFGIPGFVAPNARLIFVVTLLNCTQF